MGSTNKNFEFAIKSLGVVKVNWTERLEFNIDIYCTSWIGGGAKVV